MSNLQGRQNASIRRNNLEAIQPFLFSFTDRPYGAQSILLSFMFYRYLAPMGRQHVYITRFEILVSSPSNGTFLLLCNYG